MRWIDQNGNFFNPPLIIDGVEHHSPSPELLIKAGYTPYTPISKPSKRVYKFDRYKVITVLGTGWVTKKAELEKAGLYDLFMAAPYLSTGNEIFAQIYRNLSKEEKQLLHQNCRYGA